MSFIEGNIFSKILAAIPNALNPVLIRGTKSKWRDDFNGSALNSDDWETVQVGSGQSIAVSTSELRINAGTVANAQTIIRTKAKFSIPCKVSFIAAISQRIVNQEFYIEVIDATGENYARLRLSGTSSNSFVPQVSNGGIAGTDTTFVAVVLTNYQILEFDIGIDEIKFCFRSLEIGAIRSGVAIRNRKLPDPNKEYFIQIRAVNLATNPTSNTILYFDSISYQAVETLSTEIVGSKGSLAGSDAVTIVPATNVIFPVTGNVAASISSDGAGYINETNTNLAANGTYSVNRDGSGRKFLHVVVETNQVGDLFVDQGFDNITYHPFPANPCTPGVNIVTVELKMRYYRIRYVNGATATTIFKINTTLKTL